MHKKIVAILLLSLNFPASALDAAKEYEIKAAFLFNLGEFIIWPDSVFAAADAPFNICVLGDDPFGERLDVITADQTVSEHPVAVLRIATVAEALECHSVFVSDSKNSLLQAIFAELKDKPVLTVGDMENFAVQGGMVQLFPRNNKIRLMLNPKAFSSAGLKASALLMRIAQLVNEK
jgi:hypothetical protein